MSVAKSVPNDDVWTMFTVAAIGKQFGMLREQFKDNMAKMLETNKLEEKFENLIFAGMLASTHGLLKIASDLDTLKKKA